MALSPQESPPKKKQYIVSVQLLGVNDTDTRPSVIWGDQAEWRVGTWGPN